MASRDHRRHATGALPPGGPALRRRELLGVGVGVTAASVATMGVAGTALAQTSGSGGEQPTVSGTDLDTVRFLLSAELAVIEAYESALDAGRLKAPAGDQATTFLAHHRDHAAKLTTFAGSQAPTQPNAGLLMTLASRIGGAQDEKALAEALGDIEQNAMATYLAALDAAQDWQLVTAIATIAPVDAQHSTAWSRLVEPDPAAWLAGAGGHLPVTDSTSGQWTPSQYPVGG